MNEQPYGVPRKHWPPKLTPWWFKLCRGSRRRALKKQKIVSIEVEGLDHVRETLRLQQGVLLTPNHSFHWDSYCLLEAAHQLSTPFYIMTAWQVFELSNWFERMTMQRCGCFSVDRESTDMQAMKTAVNVLQTAPQPLVIFPEGDIYHSNDRVTPFRDGAAAMALMAARKAERTVSIIPVAIKRWFIDDPTPSMQNTLDQLEKRLYWRTRPEVPIVDRILHVADGLLALKELEHFGISQHGELPARIQHLANSILSKIESRYPPATSCELVPERVKEVRRKIIQMRQDAQNASPEQSNQWDSDMSDMFLVTQLYSYPGNYLLKNPTWERMAETLDKLEEDALHATYPAIRGRTRVKVRFDAPIELPKQKDKNFAADVLTDRIESRVQQMLDEFAAV